MNHPGRFGAGALVLVAGALLAGCASSFDPALYGAGGHLQARIYQPTAGSVQFAVSQPAYVAVFAIVPGRGAALLHPTTQSEALRRVSPGTHSYTGSLFSHSRLLYAAGPGSYYGSAMDGPTTLILIASEAPLHVTRMLRNPMLGNDLMLTSFYSHASERTVLRLAELIIPDPAGTEWTYDTYTIWPNESDRRVAAYRVRCADGQVVVVARGAYPVGCTPRVEQPPEDTSAAPSDTARVSPPKRPLQPREPVRRKPGGSVSEEAAGAHNGDALSRPRGWESRESRPRARESQPRARESQPRAGEAPPRAAAPARAQPAPRERQDAQPSRERPAEKSERAGRGRGAPPAS
ncbi:MAG TPA: hypothetical protein VFZ56_03480 [Gemmatimonadaceae bacterium]